MAELAEMTGSCWKWLEIARMAGNGGNCWKRLEWLEMVGHGCKWVEGLDRKLLEMAKNERNWLEISGND